MTSDTDFSLDGKAVVVLGATGGIGSELVSELKNRGAKVCCVGTSAAKLAALGVGDCSFEADLRDPLACRDALDFALTNLGELDVVVNSTGVVAFGPAVDLSSDAMEELFMVNTFIPIMVTKYAMNRISEGGAIVNISGVIAEKNLPNMAAYGASKAALRSFSDAMNREARQRNVRFLDARPPHTESGLATRAIQGTAPKMPEGIAPQKVAQAICDGIESGATELPSKSFR